MSKCSATLLQSSLVFLSLLIRLALSQYSFFSLNAPNTILNSGPFAWNIHYPDFHVAVFLQISLPRRNLFWFQCPQTAPPQSVSILLYHLIILRVHQTIRNCVCWLVLPALWERGPFFFVHRCTSLPIAVLSDRRCTINLCQINNEWIHLGE